jgi:hypothetical protein
MYVCMHMYKVAHICAGSSNLADAYLRSQPKRQYIQDSYDSDQLTTHMGRLGPCTHIIQSARLTSTLTQVICRPVLVNTRTVPLIRPNKKPGNVAVQVLQWIAFSHRFQKTIGTSLGNLETNSAIILARRDTCIIIHHQHAPDSDMENGPFFRGRVMLSMYSRGILCLIGISPASTTSTATTPFCLRLVEGEETSQ